MSIERDTENGGVADVIDCTQFELNKQVFIREAKANNLEKGKFYAVYMQQIFGPSDTGREALDLAASKLNPSGNGIASFFWDCFVDDSDSNTYHVL
jgi:hypothetical protein